MGKRKDKTKWSQVNVEGWCKDNFGATDRPVSSLRGGGRKRQGGRGRGRSCCAGPRLLRRLSTTNEIEQQIIEEFCCEGNDLPSNPGFTKIRSKNLDVIFKRDLYGRKEEESPSISSPLTAAVYGVQHIKLKEEKEKNEENGSTMLSQNASTGCDAVNSFSKLDVDEIPEFRPRTGAISSQLSRSPNDSGYCSSLQESVLQDCPAGVSVPSTQFYLYSPLGHALIPCEEIVITNPVLMTPEGPVCPGPTKAYVAYPVQGPQGRGYITQSFSPPALLPPPPSQSSLQPGQQEGSLQCPVSVESEAEAQKQKPRTEEMPSHESAMHNYYTPGSCSEVVQQDMKALSVNPAVSPSDSAHVQYSSRGAAAGQVYIPGLPDHALLAGAKKPRKKRRRRLKQKSSGAGSSPVPASSDDAISPHDIDTDKSDEGHNELNLTDDLANFLVNPPVDDENIFTPSSSPCIRAEANLQEEAMEEISIKVKEKFSTLLPLMEPNHQIMNSRDVGKFKEPPTYKEVVQANLPEPEEKKCPTKNKCEFKRPLSRNVSNPNTELYERTENLKQSKSRKPRRRKNREFFKESEESTVLSIHEIETKTEESDSRTAIPCEEKHESTIFEVLEPSSNKQEKEMEENESLPVQRQEIQKPIKRSRRKKKSQIDDSTQVQRVLVCDQKVDVMSFMKSDERMSEAATGEGASCCSLVGTGMVVRVRELGHGMERGELHLRRPFNGRYTPPQRVVRNERAEEKVSAVTSKIADCNDEGCVRDSLDDDIMELD